MSEVDVGGELTVDHFRPVSGGGDDSDANLVYACSRCNEYKGKFRPCADDDRAGRRVLHPVLDDITAHVREDRRSGELISLTATGQFHIDLLRLNRTVLVLSRLRRRIDELRRVEQEAIEAENARLRAIVAALSDYKSERGQLPENPEADEHRHSP